MSCWLKFFLTELGLVGLDCRGRVQRDLILSDAKSVTTTLHTIHMPRERNLSLDLARLRQLVDDGASEFLHVSANLQVADALTKPSVATHLLRSVAEENVVTLPGLVPTFVSRTVPPHSDLPVIAPDFHPLYNTWAEC